jgi:hypothetical protein
MISALIPVKKRIYSQFYELDIVNQIENVKSIAKILLKSMQ